MESVNKKFQFRLSFFLFLFLFLSSFPLFTIYAYRPKLSTILSRTTENHGLGLYLIVQEVLLKESQEVGLHSLPDFYSRSKKGPLLIREEWLVKSETAFRLNFKGQGQFHSQIKGTYVYHEGKRYFRIPTGELKSLKRGIFWFEDFFHFRDPNKMLDRIKKKGILFSDTLELSTSFKKKNISNTKEQKAYLFHPHVRLARVGGVISYGIGKPSYFKTLFPGLWIEQDYFLIRKIRFLNEGVPFEVKFQDYTFSKGRWHPNLVKIKWKKKEAFIKLISIRSLRSSRKISKNFLPKSLLEKNSKSLAYQWEEGENEFEDKQEEGRNGKREALENNTWRESLSGIKEFYHQFR